MHSNNNSGAILIDKEELGKGHVGTWPSDKMIDITLGLDTARTFLGIAAPETPEEQTSEEKKEKSLPETGEWKDQTTLKYNGKYFRDSDIYKGENTYEQVDGDCKSTVKIVNMFTEGTLGELTQKEKQGNDCKEVAVKSIALDKPTYRQYNGYRLSWDTDDQTIFMPQYSDCSNQGTSSDCPTETMGFFRRQAVGNEYRNDDQYWQWAGQNGYVDNCGDVGKVWIAINESQQRSQNKHCRGIASVQLILAPKEITPPEDVYGNVDVATATVEGANGNPGGSSLGSNGGTIVEGEEAAPNCESESKLAFGWLLCGMLNMIDSVLGQDGQSGLLGMVDSLLSVDSKMYQNPELIKAWAYFRNVATFLLILVGLTMIIGQAVSKE